MRTASMNELQEVVQYIGPVMVRRLDEKRVVLGIHIEREDGCGTLLEPEQCLEVAQALTTTSHTEKDMKSTIPPFSDELIRRCKAASGMGFTPHTHSGVVKWLADECGGLSPMTTSRYLHGRSFPTPHIAKEISKVLDWPWDELVASIVEAKVGHQIRKTIKHYHAHKMPENWMGA